ncbi:MAG: hypothetical protein HN751_04765 [Cryomorphaceae bacterium]|nr:hypothetical protein [Cryomorphaceae bacterium]
MKYTSLNKLLSFIRVKQTMLNTNKIFLLLILMFFTSNITIGQENQKIRYNKGYSSELVESFSSFQKDLLKREKILWTRHHEVIKKSLSESQKKIIKDSSLSRRDARQKIILSLDDTQKKMLKKFEQRIDTIRLKFKKSLTENQKKMIRKKKRKSKKND